MIAFLAGELLSVSESYAVINVGGVGYRVEIHPSAASLLPERGAEVRLHIHTCVREDAITLFGFMSAEAREVFELLLGVSGVGPKVALSLVSSSSLGRLKAAIGHGEVAALVKVPGVGRKTAERIIIDLKDKVQQDEASEEADIEGMRGDTAGEATAVLVELGYSRQRAREAVARAGQATDGVETLIREALKYLGSQ